MFTDTISPVLNTFGRFNNAPKIVIKTTFSTKIGNIYSNKGRCEGYCYWEYPVASLNVTLLSEPENYSKVTAKFSLYGKADDGFKFYLNGTNVASFQSHCKNSQCTSKSDWVAAVHSFDLSITSLSNTLQIKAYSYKNDYWAEVYSATLIVETESK